MRLSPDLVTVDVNNNYLKLIGKTREQYLGKEISKLKFLSADAKKDIIFSLEEAKKLRSPRLNFNVTKTADGEIKTRWINCPIYLNGELIAIDCYGRVHPDRRRPNPSHAKVYSFNNPKFLPVNHPTNKFSHYK